VFSKADYTDWKTSAVTKGFFQYIEDLIAEAKDTLASDAGNNPLQDRHLVGGIDALRDILEWQPDLEEEDKNDD
jgi:hypothetical protein